MLQPRPARVRTPIASVAHVPDAVLSVNLFRGRTADVIFGQACDSILLGAFTLEGAGLSLDPLRRELRPLPMVLAPLAEQRR